MADDTTGGSLELRVDAKDNEVGDTGVRGTLG